PKSLLSKITGGFLVPVFTGVIGLGVGLGTNYFQSIENMKSWKIQHDAETKSTLLSKRMSILTSLQEHITQYFEFDAETDIESNANTFKVAIKTVIPDYTFGNIVNLPSFPTAEQMKEHKETWSSLKELSQSIDVYFGDKIGDKAAKFLKSLSEEPTNS